MILFEKNRKDDGLGPTAQTIQSIGGTAWGVQMGKRQPQFAHPAGGPPLKRPQGLFRGGPPAGHRRVWHGRTE
jgi:hypothetical protein